MENIILNPSKVWIAENSSNGNMQLKFSLCDFSVNLNGVQLNRATITSWMGSIVNQPLVGKIIQKSFGKGEDFAGHQMRKTYVKDDYGNMVQVISFDTNAYGVFTDIAIEDVDGVECLVANCEVWDRYPKTVRLIKDRVAAGTLRTSWEISVNDYTMTNDGIKVINDGVFTALALLGERVQPAFPETSRLLEVAEAVDDLASAMEDDMKETEMEKDMNPVVETSEIETAEPDISEVAEIEAQPELVSEESDATETVSEDPVEEPIEESEESTDSVPAETTEASEESEEIASLTVNDLRDKIGQAVREKLNQYCWVSYLFPEERAAWVEPERRESELDYLLFTYSVEGDEVIIDDGTPVKLSVSIASINETLAEKDAAIAAMITENTELKAQIEELNKIKAEYDKIQKKKAEDELAQKQEELRAYAMRSGLFTEGELSKGNAKKLIDALNKTAIDQIIADRYMAQLKSVKSDSAVETSEVHEKHDAVDLASNEESPVHVNVVRAYLDN